MSYIANTGTSSLLTEMDQALHALVPGVLDLTEGLSLHIRCFGQRTLAVTKESLAACSGFGAGRRRGYLIEEPVRVAFHRCARVHFLHDVARSRRAARSTCSVCFDFGDYDGLRSAGPAHLGRSAKGDDSTCSPRLISILRGWSSVKLCEYSSVSVAGADTHDDGDRDGKPT
ncbi:hypothetical protein CDD83_6238 [Cordyceps sp. RAO-2017]|nr:hypothetical protein CDD83_6238 [Cordyceps sp. RAO-2017]